MLVKNHIYDTDGRPTLDFLGKTVKAHAENVIDKEIFAKMRDFVRSEYEKFAKEGNDKLAAYYYRLMRYIKSRQEIWDVD